MRQVPPNTDKMSNFHTFRFRVSDPAKVHDLTCAVLGLPGGVVVGAELTPVAARSPNTTWDVGLRCFVATCTTQHYSGPPLASTSDLVQALRGCVGPGVALTKIPVSVQ